MCGIVGYVGKNQAAPIVLEGLSKLEYRGYDSAGIAIRDGEKPAVVVKEVGKLINLANKTDGGKAVWVHAVSAIQDGLPTVHPARQMRITMYQVTVQALHQALLSRRS